MIRLLIEESGGYRLYMESDGFTKRFYVTDLNDVFVFWDVNLKKGQFFNSIVDAANAFDDAIHSLYDRKEVRE